MSVTVFANATLVLPDRLVPDGVAAWPTTAGSRARREVPATRHIGAIDLGGMYLAPGFVDLHVHGGDGADFMDGTRRRSAPCAGATPATARRASRRPAPSPATTVPAFLDLCGELYGDVPGGARIVGSHFYGPYFARPARGCHPDPDFLIPDAENAERVHEARRARCRSSSRSPRSSDAEWLVRTYCRPRRAVQRRAHPRDLRAGGGRGAAGACGTSITSSARCPTAPGCGRRRPTRCAAG